jgi:hypothetical protein
MWQRKERKRWQELRRSKEMGMVEEEEEEEC